MVPSSGGALPTFAVTPYKFKPCFYCCENCAYTVNGCQNTLSSRLTHIKSCLTSVDCERFPPYFSGGGGGGVLGARVSFKAALSTAC